MYADDLSLVTDSPDSLQAMPDIVHQYAKRWRYQLNGVKSVAMVFGESSSSRRAARSTREWRLGDTALQEVDEQHHLGILRSVHSSTIHRTSERATSGRSAFFALNSVGSRFGCLHPLTSLKLYNFLCMPILLYGYELWTLSRTELLLLERVHRKIHRTIQDLPIRCKSASLTTLPGSRSIEDHIKLRMIRIINHMV